jgi:hypothetical protein
VTFRTEALIALEKRNIPDIPFIGANHSANTTSSALSILKIRVAMGAELARVRFFVEALKSGDSSYRKI